MLRIEYSTMCFNQSNYREKIISARDFVHKQGFQFGIQIHNSTDKQLFEKVLEFKDELSISVHSPIFAKYFLNLASTDFQTIKESFDACTRYLTDLGTDILFFHGFFMTDKPIPHDMKNYRRTIRAAIGDAYSLNNSFVMDPAIFYTEDFLRYKEIFRNNLQKVTAMFPDFTIALENDFPLIGGGLQRPCEIHQLIDNLWFDLGHFWCASLVHKFDFYQETDRILDEKNIVGYHLNHNLSGKDTAKDKIKDSHTHLYLESEMDLKPIVRKIFEKSSGIVVLEILDGNIHDLEVLFDWIS
jgi:hypothetical protein